MKPVWREILMSRLRSLSLNEFDPELRAMRNADFKSERELRPMSVRAHQPQLKPVTPSAPDAGVAATATKTASEI